MARERSSESSRVPRREAASGVSAADLRELVELMQQRDLEEITLERETEGLRLRLRRPVQPMPTPASGEMEIETQGIEAGEIQPEESGAVVRLEPAAADPPPKDQTVPVRSRLVGRFHRALRPGAEPLVAEDDEIDEGQVLGVIETLNVFTEVEAERAGRVVKFLVEDGEPVEYGQPLVTIEPVTR